MGRQPGCQGAATDGDSEETVHAGLHARRNSEDAQGGEEPSAWWLASGYLPGAKLGGKEWRVQEADLVAFMARERDKARDAAEASALPVHGAGDPALSQAQLT